jgi:hypothetical protein
MLPRLSPHARRALIEISSRPHGVSEDVLSLDGFDREMLANLVRTGLVTVATEAIGPLVKLERYRLTDDGRKAING